METSQNTQKSETPVVTTRTVSTQKKSNNTLLIVIIILVVLAVVCCGPFLFIPAALIGALPFLSFLSPVLINDSTIQNAIENSIESQTDGNLDLGLNYDKTKTQPLPTTVPQDIRTVFTQNVGNPYNVTTSTSDTDSYVLAWFSVNKDFTNVTNGVEKDLKTAGWSVQKNSTSDSNQQTIVLVGTKTEEGKDKQMTASFTKESTDLEIVLTVSY